MGEPIVASCTLGNNQPVVISASGVHGNRENSTEDVSEIVKDTKPEVIESKLVLTVDATENVSNIKVSGDSTFVKITKSEFTHGQVVTKIRQDSLGEVKANGDTIPSEKADNEEKSTQNETGHEKESNINANETPESSDSKLQQHEKDETKGSLKRQNLLILTRKKRVPTLMPIPAMIVKTTQAVNQTARILRNKMSKRKMTQKRSPK